MRRALSGINVAIVRSRAGEALSASAHVLASARLPNRAVAMRRATTMTARPFAAAIAKKKLQKPGNPEIDEGRRIPFTFVERMSGEKIAVEGAVGRSLLDVAIDNNVDIEGACGGELACSTCHVIVSPSLYSKLPVKKVEEEDMLDLAQGLTEYSRLCCQLKVSDLIKGAEFIVPNDAN